MRRLTRAALLLVGLVACGGPGLSPRPGSDAAFFPHPEDFDEGVAHGRLVAEAGVERCTGCHDPQSTDEARPPGCRSCHTDYPHPDGWRSGAHHGDGLSGADADRSACLACHAGEGLATPEQVGCDRCHGSYPHPSGWDQGAGHGAYAVASAGSAAVCGACHGPDLAGTDTAPACATCHAAFPHPDGWAEPGSHGIAARTDLPACAGCHATDGAWDGGSVGVACSRCHAAFPHSDDPLHDHIAVADARGEAVCLRCHDPGDGPATMVATCARRCHGGEP